jgi:hypothetical protein
MTEASTTPPPAPGKGVAAPVAIASHARIRAENKRSGTGGCLIFDSLTNSVF